MTREYVNNKVLLQYFSVKKAISKSDYHLPQLAQAPLPWPVKEKESLSLSLEFNSSKHNVYSKTINGYIFIDIR